MSLTDDQRHKVRQQVSICLRSLGGGSGHLANYTIAPDTLYITQIENIGGGKTKYSFETDAYYGSEFMVGEEDGGGEDGPSLGSATRHITGYVGLDDQFNLARDEAGKVIFGPWHYVAHTGF